MPAPWSAGFRVRVIGKLQGQDCIQVLHFATNQVINDPAALNQLLQQLCAAMLGCLTDELLNAVTADYTLLGVEGTQIHPTLSDPVFESANAGAVGFLPATSVSFAAALIQIRTGTGGKSGRGRNYWPPPGEAQITNSTIDLAARDPFLAFIVCVANKFFSANPTTPFRLGVLSRKKVDNNPQPFDQAFRLATSMILVPEISVMSSRKVGSGS